MEKPMIFADRNANSLSILNFLKKSQRPLNREDPIHNLE